MFGPRVELAFLRGFQGDPYDFKLAARNAARNLKIYWGVGPTPHVSNLGQWLFGTPNWKGVLYFSPRDGGVSVGFDSYRVNPAEIDLVMEFIDKLVDELLMQDIIDDAELDL